MQAHGRQKDGRENKPEQERRGINQSPPVVAAHEGGDEHRRHDEELAGGRISASLPKDERRDREDSQLQSEPNQRRESESATAGRPTRHQTVTGRRSGSVVTNRTRTQSPPSQWT